MRNDLKKKILAYGLAITALTYSGTAASANNNDEPTNMDYIDLIPSDDYDKNEVVIATPMPAETPVVNPGVNQNTCAHVFNSTPDDMINPNNPNCVVAGEYDDVYYCVKCGYRKLVHVTVPAPGHNWSSNYKTINYVEATYDKEGGYDKVYECLNKGCNETNSVHVVIPKKNKDNPQPTEEPVKPQPTEEPHNNKETKKECNCCCCCCCCCCDCNSKCHEETEKSCCNHEKSNCANHEKSCCNHEKSCNCNCNHEKEHNCNKNCEDIIIIDNNTSECEKKNCALLGTLIGLGGAGVGFVAGDVVGTNKKSKDKAKHLIKK